ncbi:MAG: phosphotransferase family protein, partial [Vampirovibrionia bacterium]
PELPGTLKTQIEQILKKAEQILETVEEKDLALCHNDLHSLNMLVKRDDVVFIDWTYAGIGPIQYDLAYAKTMMQLEPYTLKLFSENYDNSDTSLEEDKLEANCKGDSDKWVSLVWTFWLFWGLQALYHKNKNDNDSMFSSRKWICSYLEGYLNEENLVDKTNSYIDLLSWGKLELRTYKDLAEFIVQCFRKC